MTSVESSLSSQVSTVSSNSHDGDDICRICHCEGQPDCTLISPCYCSGTLRYVHRSCLEEWIRSSGKKCCEICKFDYIIHAKLKPFKKWEMIKTTPRQQMMLVLSIIIHIIAIPTVVFVVLLIKDSTRFDWFFWLNLTIISLGVLGEIIFTCIQCRIYGQIFRRWRDLNNIIFVESVPEVGRTQQQQQQEMNVISVPCDNASFACQNLSECSMPQTVMHL